jgi:hypothetical protein
MPASSVVIRANGETYTVNGALKVVKEAIERGDLIALNPIEEPQAPAAPAKAEK